MTAQEWINELKKLAAQVPPDLTELEAGEAGQTLSIIRVVVMTNSLYQARLPIDK